MILPNQLKEHLKGPKSSYVGTRDKNFDCDILRVLGVIPTGHDTVKFFVYEKSASKTLDNLRSNKIVSLSVTNIFTAESFQLKGRMLTIKPVSQDEAKDVLEYINQFDEAASKVGFRPGMIFNNLPFDPALAIEFSVEQIFDQTPKVGTGKQLTAV